MSETSERAEQAERAEAAQKTEKKPIASATARQWVTLRGGSMDLRVGAGIVSDLPRALKSTVGRPHGCALLHEPGSPAAAVETLRQNLSDQGFELSVRELPFSTCDLAAVGELDALLAELHITADDLVVVVGGYESLSVSSFACASWCGGVPLAEVPTDPFAAIVAGATPRALDLPGLPRVIAQDGSARFTSVDPELFDCDPTCEPMLRAFAVMTKTAMCDSDRAFGALWDATDDLAAGNVDVLIKQFQATIRSRGKVIAASSAAMRQSIEYGQSFSHALRAVVGDEVPLSSVLADGLRFCARLAAASESLPVDDMFTQDELLERLGLGTTSVAVDPDRLLEAMRAERYARTKRLMLALPRALGRVRLTAIDDSVLAEHVGAWCAARPTA